MITELGALRHKVEVSRGIVGRGIRSGEDPIIREMVVSELEKSIPEWERRVRQLEAPEGRRRSKERRRRSPVLTHLIGEGTRGDEP